MKLGKILHLGIVVEDLEKAVDLYENRLGIGPWEMRNENDFFNSLLVNGTHDGLPIITAMFFGDGYEIELVQPIGEGIYMDWLRKHGPGMHHIKLESDDSYAAIVGEAREISGRPPYLEVTFPDGTPLVAYADLQKEAGLLLEVGNEPPKDQTD